ncbi:FimB/Mfa2 family fimbrial subunit [Parapedobacter pyrenivorans]|uniref:FimB/Mfa2 family fimbrial subunit n=1 Tax=Parapedobacter pyrenivorans TaxID=1305674 RepID=UPI003341E028
MNIFYHLRPYCYIFLALVFVSCIKEDLEICLPQTIRVAFTFVRSVDCQEEITASEDINRLTVFVFDENGLFVQQVDIVPTGNNYQMELSLVPANYQFVAIAGYEDDQLRGTPFVHGAHLEDAAIAAYLEGGEGYLQSANYILYKGSDTLTVIPETTGQELNLTVIQRTKAMNINVEGLNGVGIDKDFQIALAGNAAQYTFMDDQQIFLAGNPSVFVELEPGLDDEAHHLFGRIMLNWPLSGEISTTRLQVIDPETGYRLVDEDLYELLRRVPNLDPECENSFDIDFLYTVDLKIKIYINQWLVSEDGYELQ